ncbi:cupin domain-containing protein [Methanobacterium alcaliphilum]|uniref:cupin domain-containing protein n=1 Tax=Methanobacterium alcaliphilum TaxID=392018 RepID=UPI00200B69F7|nr:cupin domain-containing protein [Methanobacterium alcaliphilum]MCK9152328.1 cupin domain-containing protein [Methanobacterium alcaliphilum]
MLIRDIKTAKYFVTTDKTTLCELLHPQREEEEVKMNCSISCATLPPGDVSHPHRLKTSGEVYVILQGKGIMHIDDEEAFLEPGQAVYIPPGAMQFIQNISNKELKFLCVVSPPWSAEDDEICLE